MNTIVKRAYAGQHDGARVSHLFGALCNLDVGPNFQQSLVYTAQVARTVIKQSNHREKITAEIAAGQSTGKANRQIEACRKKTNLSSLDFLDARGQVINFFNFFEADI